MAAGVAAGDGELALALFRQGCFDVLNGEQVLTGREPQERFFAVAVAQFQQGCEKALKAWLVTLVGRSTYVRPSHLVWSEDLQNEALDAPKGKGPWAFGSRPGDLQRLRQKVEGALGEGIVKELRELEGYAPFRSWNHPNTEYPWVDEHGVVRVPAEFFDDKLTAKLGRTARRVLRAVKEQDRAFHREWKKVKEVLG